MNKQKHPVILVIENTSFEVDIDKQLLRQTNDSSNTISFIKQMQDEGTGYRLLYDTIKLNAADERSDQELVKVITIPRLAELDPEGMAAKYHLTPEQLKGKTDFEIIVDQHALYHRLNGIVPLIDLAGELFTIDIHNHNLRHSHDTYPVIGLDSLVLTDDGWHYEGYYNPVLKQVVEIDPKLLELPESVVKIRIPNEIGLDPVGTAREYGIDEREMLRRYLIQDFLKAEIIPLSETHIPALIRRNKEALLEEHRENARKLKPRQRPKF